MGRISSAIGLISGLNIQDIVSKLISIESQPVTQIQTRITENKSQQTAFLGLSASLASLQLKVGSLANPGVLNARTANSSNPSILTATATSNAPLASYQVLPVRLAQPQQLLSSGFSDATNAPVGAGTLTVKLGGFVQANTSLDALNGGQGVQRGKIRITDRSGSSAVIDLSTARTVNDVLSAINGNTNISVKASVSGDQIVLQDLTGATASNLTVAEAGSTATAANLGLLGTSSTATLTGSDVVKLGASLRLGFLNDGNGVRTADGVPDFQINLKDGSALSVDLGSASTLGQVLDAINNATGNGGKVTASIDAGGDRIKLTDNTGGGGTLSVAALSGSRAASDLGILGNEQAAGVLTGKRVLSGLNTVLLSDLRGGSQSLTTGSVQITRTGGGSATLDLSSAVTLADVVAGINAGASGIGVSAAVNAAGNGIVLTDSTGGGSAISATDTSGNLASYLKLTGASSAGQLNSGDLSLRYISENTRLEQLNGGAGISRGSFRLTDRNGHAVVINLTDTAKQTVGDVLEAINSSGAAVSARINDTGDGILIAPTAGTSGDLTIAELGGTTAKSLRLTGGINGDGAIDGAYRYQVTLSATDTLNDVVQKLTAVGAPILATVINDGGGANAYHLLASSANPGAAGRLVIDPGATGLQFSTLNEASDAVLQIGGNGGSNLLFTSNSNTFSQVLPGLSVTLSGTSATPVTISVGQNNQSLQDGVDAFVDGFNAVATSLNTLTAYDTTTGKSGSLHADSTAQRLQSALSDAVSRTYGAGTTNNFAQLGITFKNGQLAVDTDVLQSRLASDPAGVQSFLGDPTTGAVAKLKSLLDAFNNSANGTITQRVATLNIAVESLQTRTDFLNKQLDSERQRLLLQFTAMEKALAQLQAQSTAVTQLQLLAGLTTTNSNLNSNGSNSSSSNA